MTSPSQTRAGKYPDKTKVVFFGTERESSLVLEKLLASGLNIALVITKPDSRRGRGQKLRSPDVKKLAVRHDIPVLQPESLKGWALPGLSGQSSEASLDSRLCGNDNRGSGNDNIGNGNDSVGILVSYGKIVPTSIIDAFEHGIINLHPSLLPKYRGASPVEAAILNGDHETGVSLMLLEAGMDSGPIFAQTKITLDGTETAPALLEKLVAVGAELLISSFDKILSGELKPTPQDDSQATFTRLLTKADGNLDTDTMTATECERKIRAFLGFPKTRIRLDSRLRGNDPSPLFSKVVRDGNGTKTDIIVTKAKVLDGFNGDDWADVIKCAGDSYLQIQEIISPISGKTMPISDYIRGLKL